jgi:Putative auto-transporter adhesin, head GIN domain
MQHNNKNAKIAANRLAISPIAIALIVIGVIVVVVAVAAIYWYSPGTQKTETFPYTDFTQVEVSSAFQVTITESETYSIKVTAGERIFDRIQVNKTGETLKIGTLPITVFLGSFDAKAEITMPALNKLDLSGATQATVSGFSTTESFAATVTGASSLELTDVKFGDVNIQLSGASHMVAAGTGNNLAADVSGASNLDLTSFRVNDANVNVSGASHATVNLDGRLDVDASGMSSLEYIGDPTLGTINTSGGSSVNKK